jgi:hypothetical protein
MAIGQAYIAQRQEEAAHQAQQQRAIPAHSTVVEQRQMPQPQPQQHQQPAQQRPPVMPHVSPTDAAGPESVMLAMLPPNFQTPEWRAIIVTLHKEPPPDVESIATILAHHLQHLAVFNLVPPELANVFADPRGTLTTMLQFMPVAGSKPDYARAVIDRVVQLLEDAGLVQRATPAQGAPQSPAVGAPGDDDDVDDGDDDEVATYPAQA